MTHTLIAVTARIFSNAASNVYQKKLTESGADPFFVNLVTYGALSLVGLAVVSGESPLDLPMEFWLLSIFSGITGALGNGFIVKALETGELSVLGPVNAYKPVVGMAFTFILTSGLPNPAGAVGIALVVVGSYFVLDTTEERFSWALMRNPSIRYRIAALVLTGFQAVVDKELILLSNLRMAFFSWSFFGLLFTALIWLARRKRETRPGSHDILRQWRMYLMLTACIGIMVASTNFTFSWMPVGEALALFQLSGILTVYWGYRYFNERHLFRKMAGALIMVAGASLILLTK